MQKSLYGNTKVIEEYLIYPFTGPIGYNYNYTGTYSKYSMVDKYYVDSLIKSNKRLIYGGAEWCNLGLGGLTFSVSNILYSFTGEVLSYSAGTPGLSFSAGHSVYSRIDSLVINEGGQIQINQGIPSAVPQKPRLLEDQILLQYAVIAPNATSFGASEPIYINNSQWLTSTYQTSGSISGAVDFTAPNPYAGVCCVDVNTDYRTGIKFTKSTGSINADNYSSITMRVKLISSVPRNKILIAQITGTSSTVSGTASNIINLMSYGLDREVVGTWQHVVIPMAKFGSRVNSIKEFTMRMPGGASGQNTNWQVDYILMQKGVAYDEYISEPSEPPYTPPNIINNNEWYASVISATNSEPVASPSVSDRYLVAATPSATGDWLGKENTIAEFDISYSWIFTTPTNGSSVRVDSEDNSIYRYEGVYPTGQWYKELVSQLRYLSATTSNYGASYSATSVPNFYQYDKELLFLTKFGYTNSGTASLNINGIGDLPILKIAATAGLINLAPADIKPEGVYSVSYDGVQFQVNLGGGGGSGVGGTGVIGDAEDGDYTDGVFTDFTPTTPIGTAIDRFNELFMALVPSSAPALSEWSGSRTGGANGKLSFDDSNPIAGSTYYGANTAPSPVNVDGTWTSSGKRLSIYAAGNTNNITGTLNNTTPASTTTPTPAYPAYSFGDADKGNIKLSINGVIVSTASLTTLTAIDTTSGSSVSGLILSAATSSKFSSGVPFESFKHRTGTYLVKYNDPNIRYGYNYAIAEHSSTSFTRTLTRYEFIVDHNTDSTSFSGESITSYLLTGSKYLSGIGYFTGGNVKYDLTISNLYRNTYYSGSDAITFNDQSTVGNAGTNPLLTVSAQYALLASSGNELRQVILSTDFGSSLSLTFNIISSAKRRLNDPIGLNTTAKRTLQGTSNSTGTTITNVYLDNVAASSTDLYEGFDDEGRRLKEGSYNLISDVSSGTWVSSQSLTTGDSNHNTGLQVYNSRLVYPTINFSTPGSLTTNLNYGSAGTNYSSASGTRTYIRYFRQVSPTTGNFTITINGGTGTFVAIGTALTGNNIHLEFKAPGTAAAETGWLDAYADFVTNQWADGDGGRKESNGAGRAFGTAWGLTIGTKNTSNTGGYIIVKLSVGSSFAGNLTDITFAFV